MTQDLEPARARWLHLQGVCQSCHVGYGWKDGQFDFQAQTRVDCLVCHHGGGYRKPPALAGELPATRIELPPGSGQFVGPIDLAKVAQGVGASRIASCGSCHFDGGDGDGVKHGDLDSCLARADRNLDVHMASKDQGGAGFTGTTCHETEAHRIPGRLSAMTAADPHGVALRGARQGRSLASCTFVHVYLTTTGHTVFAHLKTMITG